jgi:hypothetical protein
MTERTCPTCQHCKVIKAREMCFSPQVMAAHKHPAFAFHECDTLDIEHQRDTPERRKCGPQRLNHVRRTA